MPVATVAMSVVSTSHLMLLLCSVLTSYIAWVMQIRRCHLRTISTAELGECPSDISLSRAMMNCAKSGSYTLRSVYGS